MIGSRPLGPLAYSFFLDHLITVMSRTLEN